VKEELLKTAFDFLRTFLEDKGSTVIDTGYNALINGIMEWTFSLINAFGCAYEDVMMKQVAKDEKIVYDLLKSGMS
jgi:hypothetical protein